MYLTLGVAAVYTASSYYYNHYNRARANEYRQKAGASFAVMQGSLATVLNGITPSMYKKLLSDGIKLIPDSYYINVYLDRYIKKFGVHNMQSAIRAVLEGEVLEELPYLYMPYHQDLKQIVGAIGVGEIIYQQFDTIRLLYDYQIGHLDIVDIIRKYGIEIVPTLKKIGADFSGLSDYDIYHIVNENGIEFIEILINEGIALNNMSELYIFSVVFSFGKNYILLLKNAGANFSKLYGDSIVGISKTHGQDSLQLLKDAGVDFNKLAPYDIAHLIKNHGLEIIPYLINDLDVKITKIGGCHIVYVAKEYGMDSLHILKESGADFNALGSDDISHLILDQGLDVVSFLVNERADFSKMGKKDIMPVLDKYGKGGIDTLYPVGVDFSTLSLSDVLSVIDNYGEEVIGAFQDAEIDFANLSNQLNGIDTSDGSMTEAEFSQAFSIGLNNFNFEF